MIETFALVVSIIALVAGALSNYIAGQALKATIHNEHNHGNHEHCKKGCDT